MFSLNQPDLSSFFEASARVDVVYNSNHSTLLRDSMRVASAFAERAAKPGEVIMFNSGVLSRPFMERLVKKHFRYSDRLRGYDLPMDEISKLSTTLLNTLYSAKSKVLIINSFEFAATRRSTRFKLLSTLIAACNRLGVHVIVLTDQDPTTSQSLSGAMKMLMDIATSAVPMSEVLGQIKKNRKAAKLAEQESVSAVAAEPEEGAVIGEDGKLLINSDAQFDRAELAAEGLDADAIERIQRFWKSSDECGILVPVYS